ncbi:hypothetical protein DID99_36350, partial [Burkholderia sp. Bp8986]
RAFNHVGQNSMKTTASGGSVLRGHQHPYISRKGRSIARCDDGCAGMGSWKKRRLGCNDRDTDSMFRLARKGAHFHEVFHHETY